MTDGEGETPLEDTPSSSTATLVAPRSGDGNGARPASELDVEKAGGPGRTVDGAMSYNPALDGIRGLAVGAVLFFHGGFDWARGGYLGVSTFFTLSGFLITSLLITEHRRSSTIRLTAFWARRLRRLLPAAAATLAVVMVSAVVTDELWERILAGDVVAAALNVANWRFLFEDKSYGALFDEGSPVLHFWSLAIEEQFYWIFPVLAAVVLGRAKGSLRVFGGVLLGLLGVSLVLTLIFSDRQNTVYYSTPIRMGEILVGALLAVGLALTRGRLTTTEGNIRTSVVASVLGALALVGSVWAWLNVEQSTEGLYRGGLLAYALLSGCLVFAACVPGPVRQLLAFEPLRLLGLISYGVYLIHWPVFLIMNEDRVDGWLDPFNLTPRGWKLFALKVAVTLALAIVSFRLLEQPIRRTRRPKKVKAPLLAAGSVVGVLLLAFVVPRVSEPPEDPFADLTLTPLTSGPDPSTLVPGAKIGAPYGDSTMMRVAFGLAAWGGTNHRLVMNGGGGGMGCSIAQAGDVRYGPGPGGPANAQDHCKVMQRQIVSDLGSLREKYGHVDFSLVMAGPWDVSDHRLPGSDEWTHVGRPEYDDYLRGQMVELNELLLQEGVTVVWVTHPYLRDNPNPEGDPDRMDVYNNLVKEVAAEMEGVVVVDLARYVAELPPGEDERMRPDGTHFDPDPGLELAQDWLGDAFLQAIDLERSPYPPPQMPPSEPEPSG